MSPFADEALGADALRPLLAPLADPDGVPGNQDVQLATREPQGPRARGRGLLRTCLSLDLRLQGQIRQQSFSKFVLLNNRQNLFSGPKVPSVPRSHQGCASSQRRLRKEEDRRRGEQQRREARAVNEKLHLMNRFNYNRIDSSTVYIKFKVEVI